jgi:hypothetical protein
MILSKNVQPKWLTRDGVAVDGYILAQNVGMELTADDRALLPLVGHCCGDIFSERVRPPASANSRRK